MIPSFEDVVSKYQDVETKMLEVKFTDNGDLVENYQWIVKRDKLRNGYVSEAYQSWLPDFQWKLIFFKKIRDESGAMYFELINAYFEEDGGQGLVAECDLTFTIFGENEQQNDMSKFKGLVFNDGDNFRSLHVEVDPHFINQGGPITVKLDIVYKKFIGDINTGHSYTNAIQRQVLIDSPDQKPDFFVTFDDGKRIGLHKLILATSWPHYHLLYQPGFIEIETNEVKITNFDYVTMKILFIYLYTGCLPFLSVHTAFQLLKAADYFRMDNLAVFIHDRIETFHNVELGMYNPDELPTLFEKAYLIHCHTIARLIEEYVISDMGPDAIHGWWELAIKLKHKNLKQSIALNIRLMIKERRVKKIKDIPGFDSNNAAVIASLEKLANSLCKLPSRI